MFREHELKLDMLLASAALPSAFHAVEVDKEFYWDGGYAGNTALLHELRAIAFVDRLLREQKLDPGKQKRINMHMIDAEEQLRNCGASSKASASPGFLRELFDLGRRTAADWLDRNFAYAGHASSIRIAQRFL